MERSKRKRLAIPKEKGADSSARGDAQKQQERRRKEFFDTFRKIQEKNHDTDPEEVMQDVLETQQAIRKSS